jgi:uncharacterized membrane protein YdcZ (DUF606 family)
MTMAVYASALKFVLAHDLLSSMKQELGAVGFTFWIEVGVGTVLLPFILYLSMRPGAVETLVAPLDSWAECGLLWFTAVYGGVRVFSQILLLRYATATMVSVGANVSQTLAVLISIPLFGCGSAHVDPTPVPRLAVLAWLCSSLCS